MHPSPGDPFAHEKSNPDPVERDFPAVPPALAEHLTIQPEVPPGSDDVIGGPPDYAPKDGWRDVAHPQGLDLLKLWVRQFEAAEGTDENVLLRLGGESGIRALAGIVGAWEEERKESAARYREILEKSNSRAKADRHAMLRLQEGGEAQERSHRQYVELSRAVAIKLRDERDEARARADAQAVTIKAFQEATGIDDMTEHHGGVEVIRPARDSTVVTVLSESSVKKIADEILGRLAVRPLTVQLSQSSRDRTARAVADRVAAQRGREGDACTHEAWEESTAGSVRRCVDCGATSEHGAGWA